MGWLTALFSRADDTDDVWDDDGEPEEGDEAEDYDGDDCPDPDCGCRPDTDCDCPVCADRWLTAVHEIGHVVAHLHFDDEWHSVEATPDYPNPTIGVTYSADDGYAGETSDDYAARVLAHEHPDMAAEAMVISAAGCAAERLVFGHQIANNTADAHAIDVYAEHADGFTPDDAHAEADDVVADWHGFLLECAEELFHEHVLSAADVESML